MEKLTIAEAKRLNDTMVTEDHLKLHAANVAACMGAMADHFGADKEHWEAVGYLHDYDYEKYPEEHLAHTEEPLRAEGVPEEDIRAILSHGYSICTDVEPVSDMEKSLFTVDELSGIVQAAARMRPNGIVDMSLKSFMKKWKDKRFAAGCKHCRYESEELHEEVEGQTFCSGLQSRDHPEGMRNAGHGYPGCSGDLHPGYAGAC